jgi:PIN domain nuclease of toxin-antitoxin system
MHKVILLDTHVLVWWATGNTAMISQAGNEAIEAELAHGQIRISAISAWELAMLVAKNRIALSMDVRSWLEIVGQIDGVRFLPVDNEVAIASTELPGEFHKDPADRIIVATARRLGIPLVSADEKITAYPHVNVVW